MKSGVYSIKNIVNGKRYIGSSKNVKHRLSTHKLRLKNNRHENQYLQNACNKYGIENFTFFTIEFCEEEKLIETEDKYIILFNTLDRDFGYNLELPSRHSQSPESNAKRRRTMKAKPRDENNIKRIQKLAKDRIGTKQTKEHIESVKLALSNRTPEQKQETYNKISIANKGKIMSTEAKEKLSKAMKGRIMSEEWRRKMSEAKKGKKKPFNELTRKFSYL